MSSRSLAKAPKRAGASMSPKTPEDGPPSVSSGGEYLEVTHTLQDQYGTSAVSGIDSSTRRQVIQRALSVLPELKAWLQRFPAISPKRLEASTLACVATIPDRTPSEQIMFTQACMYLWAMDDVCDGVIDRLTDIEIDTFVQRYQATVEGPDVVSWSSDRPAEIVGAAWQEILHSLRRAKGAPHYRYLLKAHRETCDCLKIELAWKRRWQTIDMLPTFAQYFSNAQVTSLGALVVLSLLVIVDEHAELHPDDGSIEQMARESGMCLRAINDVRSRKRDHLEGKPNGVAILIQEGMREADAEKEMVNLARKHLQSLTSLAAGLPETLAEWGRGVVQLWRFTIDYYLTTEFHHFTEADLRGLAT
jgi:hypothetical protein